MNQIATREKYYSDGEDALIFGGPLPILTKDVGGMNLKTDSNSSTTKDVRHPIIFSVESSCDETACAITCDGEVVSDVVASQVDFHKRFGGVVPETTNLNLEGSFPVTFNALMIPAAQTVAVPCWSSWKIGISETF